MNGVLESLEAIGAIYRNTHVVYTSGRHGREYVNKDALYPHTKLTSQFCRLMAVPFIPESIEVVAAPAVGGVILSQWLAFHLTELTGKEVLGIYAEKAPTGGFQFKRGYGNLLKGKRTLVVEDILTTGGSVKQLVEVARTHQANIVGVTALCNRGGIQKEALDVPRLFSLVELSLESWEASACPLCQQKIPINTQVGKG